MAGIYLHIPFCRQACTYCNFHFSTSLRYKNDVITAMCNEVRQEAGFLGSEKINTIYFGGGTPSLLDVSDVTLLLSTINECFTVAEDAEITIEANPDDIHEEKLNNWRKIGINRLSLGIQSFSDEELKWMHRAHSSQQAIESLQLAVQYFENITIDLIYGSPFLSDKQWKENVDRVIGMNIPHISCYALTVEEKTPLFKQIAGNQSPDVDNDIQANQYLQLMQWLRSAGYEHYEVSNFAKPGFRSRHNSSYWTGTKYLGIGPSAHSYNGSERRWNVANNNIYVQQLAKGKPKRETEVLTDSQKFNEYVMISLRTSDGLNLDYIKNKWGEKKANLVQQQLQRNILNEFLRFNGRRVQLTDEGFLQADRIASDLFDVEKEVAAD